MSRFSNWRVIQDEKAKRFGRCPVCGKVMDRRKNICPHCNQDKRKAIKVGEYKEEKIECPNCKALNEPGNVTCSSCGINFVAYEMEKPDDFSGIQGARKRRKH
ncbi:MAG: hypothetical protein FK734_05420 [Asgard group archaeon]|nr:hypothetical protein [Asgard group archaeon]